jgi:hypothetical protein
MQFHTPILFLVFNRPQPTAKVFAAIRELRPAKLYVAADGPRLEKVGEWKRCAEARAVLEKIDWDCEVRTLLRDENLGCGHAVNEAITWFFEQEEEGIILEDDCLPDASFFPFCSEMLARFRENDQVGSISGDNFFPPALHSAQPYHFSKYTQIWGWATWRRFWKKYDFHLTGEVEEWERIIRRVNPMENQARYWIEIFKAMKSGLIDTWDYQVMFSAWRAGLVHIYPSKNLILNIGYGADATHTNFDSPMTRLQTASLENFEVTLPVSVDPNLDETIFYFRFLESLSNVWWLEQALDLTQKLSWSRWQSGRLQTELNQLQSVTQKQAEALDEILERRSDQVHRLRLVLLLSHFVYTVRQAINLARTGLSRRIGRRLGQSHQAAEPAEEKPTLLDRESRS